MLLTRRDGFSAVKRSIDRALELIRQGTKLKVKINVVVMREFNLDEVLPFVHMTHDEDLEVRFIEFMPVGGNRWSTRKMVSYLELIEIIQSAHHGFYRLRDEKHETSDTWQVPGFAGKVGFITSMTHNFCASCNRIRITADGNLKVCLHGNAEVSLRDILRDNAGKELLQHVRLGRPTGPIGRHGAETMSTAKRGALTSVIGQAVRRKKFAYGDIGELQKSSNRPMILIGG